MEFMKRNRIVVDSDSDDSFNIDDEEYDSEENEGAEDRLSTESDGNEDYSADNTNESEVQFRDNEEQEQKQEPEILDLSTMSSEFILNKEFETFEEADTFYCDYAKHSGFSVRKDSLKRYASGQPRARLLVCSKEGERKEKWVDMPNRKRGPRPNIRENFPASFYVKFDRIKAVWVVKRFVREHSHALAPSEHVHLLRSHRNINSNVKSIIDSMHVVGVITTKIIDLIAAQCGGYDKMGCTRQDVYNYIKSLRGVHKVDGDVKGLLAYFFGKKKSDAGFFYEKSVADDKRLGNIFWSDSISRFDYACFGDVIAFDSAFHRNRYNRPMVNIIGINHHHQTIIFGCAVLSDSSDSNYVWMLNQFLSCMGGRKPQSVVTDGEVSMESAIKEVLPQCVHRLCSWHLKRTVRKRFHNQDFVKEFSNLMWKRMEPLEFESTWENLIRKFDLHENEWATSTFECREMWAEAYLKGHFFGGTRTTSRCEGLHSFLNKFVRNRLCLAEFVRQYEIVLARIREEEKALDHAARYEIKYKDHPLNFLAEPAARIYTPESYNKFCEQLNKVVALDDFLPPLKYSTERHYFVSRLHSSTYQRTVVYDEVSQSLVCSCKFFEFTGFPCRHQLYVIKKDLHAVPEALFLNRWTKNAKCSLDLQAESSQFSTDTIRSLRQGMLSSKYQSLIAKASLSHNTLMYVDQVLGDLSKWVDDNVNNAPPNCHGSHNHDILDPTLKKKRLDVLQTNVNPRKCSICGHGGHDRRNCPQIASQLSTTPAKKDDHSFVASGSQGIDSPSQN